MKYYTMILAVVLWVIIAVLINKPPLKAKEVKQSDTKAAIIEQRIEIMERNAIRTRAKVERINQLLEDM